MKRILSLLLALLLIGSLSACALAPQSPGSDYDISVVTKAPGETAATQVATTGGAGTVQSEAPPQTAAPAPQTDAPVPQTDAPVTDAAPELDEDGWYNSKEEVALYIHIYGKLPGNYITKKEAEDLGWPGGSLEPYAPGKSIGGGYFGNYEGLLPAKSGRKYTECDIDTAGRKSRGAKRIVFSNDGLIYYTGDHYESFELLYGEP